MAITFYKKGFVLLVIFWKKTTGKNYVGTKWGINKMHDMSADELICKLIKTNMLSILTKPKLWKVAEINKKMTFHGIFNDPWSKF